MTQSSKRWRGPRGAVLGVLILLAACSPAYTTVDQVSRGEMPPEKRFVVRAATGEWTIDSLRVEGDTLHGSIIALHPSAPRTPLQLPVASVTALRSDDSAASGLVLAAAPFALFFGFIALAFAGSGD